MRKLKSIDPCPRAWAAMSTREQGRHCDACERVVPLLRQLLAIAILPFTAAVLVPVWVARRHVRRFLPRRRPWDPGAPPRERIRR